VSIDWLSFLCMIVACIVRNFQSENQIFWKLQWFDSVIASSIPGRLAHCVFECSTSVVRILGLLSLGPWFRVDIPSYPGICRECTMQLNLSFSHERSLYFQIFSRLSVSAHAVHPAQIASQWIRSLPLTSCRLFPRSWIPTLMLSSLGNHGIMESWNHGIMESWNHGIQL
jgi:hypothetical protein